MTASHSEVLLYYYLAELDKRSINHVYQPICFDPWQKN